MQKPFTTLSKHWRKKNFKSISNQKSTEKTKKLPVQKYLSDGRKQMETSGFQTVFCQSWKKPEEALDYYVYETAFQWLADRREKQQKMMPLSLNVSPIHFRKINTFIHKVSDLIDKYKIPSQYLIFEITETTYIHNIDAVNQMIRFFQKKNIRISMDDFGSGYSSLNTLKDILFDEVKIDKRFLDDDLSEKGKIVLQEIFHLLKRTNKLIVCEGVETKEMVDFLVQEDCDELQGYYYYKPLEMQKFEALIA